MKRLELYNGDIFGRLTVIEECEPYKSPSGRKIRKVLCICECGNQIRVGVSVLHTGKTKSCGCLQKERASSSAKTHGKRHTKEYTCWAHIIQRCTNPNNWAYDYYGGRGITVCDRWLNCFENFYEDMGEAPDGMSIERIDNNLGYYKENCKWDTDSNQGFNQRKKSTNTSGVTGVSLIKSSGRWRATITVNKKNISLGVFSTIEEAAKKRKEAEILYYGREKSD